MTEEQIEEIEYTYTKYNINCMSLNSVINACEGIKDKLETAKRLNPRNHDRIYMALKHNIKNLPDHPTVIKNEWLENIYLVEDSKQNLKIAKLLFNIALGNYPYKQVRIKPINRF